MKNKWIYLLSSLFLLSCLETRKEKVVSAESVSIPIFDINSNISNSVPDTFTWNSIAKHVQLIPLSSSILLGASPQLVYLSDEFILIKDNQLGRLYSFDSTGKLKYSFRHEGNGPGEYVNLSFTRFNKNDSTIIVLDSGNKVLLYSLEGKCINEIIIKDKNWSHLCLLDEDGVLYTKNTTGNALVSVLDKEYNISKNYFAFDSSATRRQKINLNFTSNKSNTIDAYLLNKAREDTVYTIDKSGVNPLCVLKKGDHILSEENVEQIMRMPFENDYITYTSIDAFSDYLLFRYLWRGKFIVELWNNTKQDKIANSTLIQPNQYSGLEGGFNYVFDSGNKIRLLPGYVTKKRLAFFLPSEKCASELKNLKEDDNPVLMIMDLK
ncbi:6-bladed beta-propeller [uncultured Parabacteroides sp.]|uniref:6-bladed beta-propeller n=1 Tax=uncultured Parabacteroides sp. TaxID=512312 RepID=UPI00258958D2|nr:6-bladed beta-propeller [uncultured Parabacteroides sp.]